MRYLVLTILHFVGFALVLAPMVAFAIPGVAHRLPLTEHLFVGLAVYWCFLPCVIAITGGLLIDRLSQRMRGKSYFLESKWPRMRNRVIFVGLLGGALLYLHFFVFGS